MDMKFLYTNIPNHDGIQSVKEIKAHSDKSIPTKVIIPFRLIFCNMIHLQIKVCAMKTISAPSFANIFVEKF